jgi:KipI family sensor histidine kinase inhibitor
MTSAARLEADITGLLHTPAGLEHKARRWRVPVCYEGEHAPDLAYVAKETGLAAKEVVALHAGRPYHVYMIGFLPGLPYMGDLPERLVLPRRVDPRVRLPPGSVAIAMTMTIVYPLESPGGWHLIGATPVRLFDWRWPAPALLAPGDAVEFEPIGKGAFAKLARAVGHGDYEVPHERLSA